MVSNTLTRDMYLQQFNVGQLSLLAVLASYNELYSTSMQLVTAQMNEIAAQYRLITLGGKLLGYFDIDRNNLTPDTDGDDFVLADDMSTWTINNQTYLPDYPENGR